MSEDRKRSRRDPDERGDGDAGGDGNGAGNGEADAFDSLDDAEKEIDDPFAELGEGIDAGDAETGTTPSDREDSVDGGAPSEPATNPDAEKSDPFDEIGRPGAGQDDPFGDDSGEWDDEMGDLDDAFEQMDVSGPAAEDVWESLDADAGTGAFDADAGFGEARSVSDGDDTEHVVSKRTYCQQCPYFTPPPEAACTHEGTTIVEVVGFDTFRVRNCPMISEEDPTFDTGG